MSKKYEFVIIGSGAGGATLARELSKTHSDILVIEKGDYEDKFGTFADALRYYDGNRVTRVPLKSSEGVILYRTMMAGGSAFVSAGNFCRCLEKEFSELGIDLQEEFIEAENEIRIAPLADELISDSSKTLAKAAKDLGYNMQNMMKSIDASKCIKCGLCTFGCKMGAKWTPLEYLREATENGVEVLYNASVEKVTSENGKVTGVLLHRGHEHLSILANTVILAAGGIGTPVILQASGIDEAGTNLFIDTFVNIYGEHDTMSMAHEPQMAMVIIEEHEKKGFLLSTFFNHSKSFRMIESGAKGFALPNNKILGFMNKTSDEASGHVHADGTISKKVTAPDQQKLDAGADLAKEILIKVGVDPKSIIVSRPAGAHPGGTAAVGRVVDNNLETRIKNLFVCDASVFPTTPGLPPILTIIALAKRLSKKLA
jgi:choline dehydrogenase-like flavoprotein